MTTHDVQDMLGMTRQALIYYEKEGMIQPKRDGNNYRNYSQADVDILKLIQLLRSMEVPIDDIKLILDNQLSIRHALEAKQKFLKKSKENIAEIEMQILNYIKRKKVLLIKDDEDTDRVNNQFYQKMYLHQHDLTFYDRILYFKDMTSIDISLCCSKGENGMYYMIHNLYFICLDVNTQNDTYSFQIINNDNVCGLFNILCQTNVPINDPMHLIDIYQRYKNPIKLNNYINQHYHQWQKQYHLNHSIDNYWTVIQNDYVGPMQKLKKECIPTIKEQFVTLIMEIKDKFKKER